MARRTLRGTRAPPGGRGMARFAGRFRPRPALGAARRGPRWRAPSRRPGFRNSGGFCPMPMPGGVPVVTTSPGDSVMKRPDVAHQRGDAEDHGVGVAVLIALAVDLEPHRQVLQIRDLVGGHQPRPDGGEGYRRSCPLPTGRRARTGSHARRHRSICNSLRCGRWRRPWRPGARSCRRRRRARPPSRS